MNLKARTRTVVLATIGLAAIAGIGIAMRPRPLTEAQIWQNVWKQRHEETTMLLGVDVERFLTETGFDVRVGRSGYSEDISGNQVSTIGFLISNGHDAGRIFTIYRFHERMTTPSSVKIMISTDRKSLNWMLAPNPALPSPYGKQINKDITERADKTSIRGQEAYLSYAKNEHIELLMDMPWPIPNASSTAHFNRGYVDTFTMTDVSTARRLLSEVFTNGLIVVANPGYDGPGDRNSKPLGTTKAWLVGTDGVVADITISLSGSADRQRKDSQMGIVVRSQKDLTHFLNHKDLLVRFSKKEAFPLDDLHIEMTTNKPGEITDIEIRYPLGFDPIIALEGILPKEND